MVNQYGKVQGEPLQYEVVYNIIADSYYLNFSSGRFRLRVCIMISILSTKVYGRRVMGAEKTVDM